MSRYCVLFSLLILLTACQKDSDELDFSLTPATQTGTNTLSFRVEGRVFQPYGRRCFGFAGGPCIDEPLIIHYKPKRGSLDIDAFLTAKDRSEDFSLSCDSVFKPGVVGAQQPRSYSSAGLGYSSNRENFGTANPARTIITITRLDTVAHIIAGTFEGELQDYLIGSSKVVHITDGRFDVLYTK